MGVGLLTYVTAWGVTVKIGARGASESAAGVPWAGRRVANDAVRSVGAQLERVSNAVVEPGQPVRRRTYSNRSDPLFSTVEIIGISKTDTRIRRQTGDGRWAPIDFRRLAAQDDQVHR